MKPKYKLLDGPPFVSGNITPGTAYNKVLKDLFLRFSVYENYEPFIIYGWDVHGLPIELKILKELGANSVKFVNKELFIEKCRNYVNETKVKMRLAFNKLNLLEPLKEFNEQDTEELAHYKFANAAFKKLKEKNLVYEAKRIVPYCTCCESPMANVEVEYKDTNTFGYEILFKATNDYYLAIHTTTIWTLPFNVAVAYNPNLKYGVHMIKDKKVLKLVEDGPTVDVSELQYFHPLTGKLHKLYPAEFVEASYTGFVHIAPAHGEDDFNLAVKYNLPIVNHLDERGYFGFLYEKVHYKDPIIETYFNKFINAKYEITHSNAFCWRCNSLLIRIATTQLFIKVEENRSKLLRNFEKIHFSQPTYRNNFHEWLKNVRDWCISRSRVWAIPIEGTDYTFDVWFESGIMAYREPRDPDILVEGHDQIRGWFYCMHVLTSLLEDKPAAKEIVVHGYLLKNKNEKLSKSKHNVDITKILEDPIKYRLYVFAKPLGDFIFEESHIDEKWWTIYKNSLQWVADLVPGEHCEILDELTNWLWNEYADTQDKVINYLKNRQINIALLTLKHFVIETLSRGYIKYTKSMFEQVGNASTLANLRNIITDCDSLMSIFSGHTATRPAEIFIRKITQIEDNWLEHISEILKLREKMKKSLKEVLYCVKVPVENELTREFLKQSLNTLNIEKGQYEIDTHINDEVTKLTDTRYLTSYIQQLRKDAKYNKYQTVYIKLRISKPVNIQLKNTYIEMHIDPNVEGLHLNDFIIAVDELGLYS